jgi:flagellar hook-associated protein 2
VSYIDGLASGLNTTEIIKAMMAVEAIPKTLLENRVANVKAGLDAFASIRTKVATTRTAADAIAAPTAWQALSATSSNTEAVTVVAGTGTPGGSLTFSVTSLATAMVRSSGDTFGALDADLSGRTLSIDGAAFESTATTLSGLVDEINAADDLGVTASTLQVAPDQFRLVLTATKTGSDSAFTATGTGWTDAFGVITAAQDATLDVGGITVTRPSNTISDLLPGATITLKAESASPVTVSVARDVAGITTKVKALVESVNAAISEVKTRTAYNAETNQRSSLTGDSTARTLVQNLTAALSNAVAGNDLGAVGLVGIELKRDGAFTFDEVKFTDAYAADPTSVERLFVPGGDATSGITFVNAGWRAQPGTHDIELSNDGGEWSARIGGEDAVVTVNDDGSLRLAVSVVNQSMGGMTVTVDSDTAATAGVAFSTVGSVDYTPGAARRVGTMTNQALDAVTGTLTSAEEIRNRRITDINRQIAAWEIRLDKREVRLRQQYTALESLMGQLGNQATWLSGQIAGLNANLNANTK